MQEFLIPLASIFAAIAELLESRNNSPTSAGFAITAATARRNDTPPAASTPNNSGDSGVVASSSTTRRQPKGTFAP